MTKYIGGYFELEMPRGGGVPHAGLALNSGRACLAAILRQLRPRRVHVPFYACEALYAPMREAGIPVSFYPLDAALAPLRLPVARVHEMIIVINYFGLQDALLRRLASERGRQLVADHTQAFFAPVLPGAWSFSSARKYFGVPDGAWLQAPEPLEVELAPPRPPDLRHLVSRLAGRQQTGYRQVRRFEKGIDCSIRAMSPLSMRLLGSLDHAAVRRRRRENYRALHKALGRLNLYDAGLPAGATPFCYPLLLEKPVERAALARYRLYVPTLWQDVVERPAPGFAFERDFAMRLLPLPIDQRYDLADMSDLLRRLGRVVPLAP